MKILCFSLLLATILISGGCQTSQTQAGHPNPPPDSRLARGDVVKIIFSGAPELNLTQTIRRDGMISRPKLEETMAAGKLPAQLQKELKAAYKDILTNSEVTLVVENSPFPVNVIGAVGRPGEVILDDPSLLVAIGKAGGISPDLGDASRIRIIHEGDQRSVHRVVNLKLVINGESDQIIRLQRGDTIIVPEKWL
jgi:protein involved in polysaccharide export with SLBB domain